mmetsp:Transcript_66808/g.150906  ORF Transcript_66808/g.150906 Transcript_66808/m.150906 type:complete len:807 (-) Transcript_66808:273-2693(-)
MEPTSASAHLPQYTKAAMARLGLTMTLGLMAMTPAGSFALPGKGAGLVRRATIWRAGDEAAEAEPQDQLYELCRLDASGMIDECEVLFESELAGRIGEKRATRIIENKSGDESELLFSLPADSFATSKSSAAADLEEGAQEADEARDDVIFTVADWQICLADDMCQVPEDVLLKAFGPDVAQKIADKRGTENVPEIMEKLKLKCVEDKNSDDECLPDEITKAAEALGKVQAQGDDAEEEIDSRYHVHFGAGRLGMGLVVPAIAASGIPFAVVQRPKRRWQEVFASGDKSTIDFKVDGKPVVTQVEIINAASVGSEDGGDAGGGLPEFMPPQALVFGSGPGDLGALVDRATSLSCSLGSAMVPVMSPLLESLPKCPPEDQPLLFCCENDHAAVMKLKKKFADKCRVVDCMVDRVCMGRTIRPNSVDIEAEPWRGSIVPLDAGLEKRVPFALSVATLPRSTREAEYLSERKFSLVNGMHTVMAFMTLIKSFEGVDQEYVLAKYPRLPREEQLVVEAWRAARAAQLMDEFGMEDLMAWHGCSEARQVWDILLDFGDEVLVDRFAKVDDLVSRVLGGGVANRWLTRLQPIQKWLADCLARKEERERKARLLGADSQTVREVQQEAKDAELFKFFEYAMSRGPAGEVQAGSTSCLLPAAGSTLDQAHLEDALPLLQTKLEAPRPNEVFEKLEELAAEAGSPEGATTYVQAALDTFVESSRPFCRRELDKSHQAFIKEQRRAGGKKFSPTAKKALEKELLGIQQQLAAALMANAGIDSDMAMKITQKALETATAEVYEQADSNSEKEVSNAK